MIEFSAAAGSGFRSAYGLTDSSGQVATNVTLGGIAGRYQLTAFTIDKSRKKVAADIERLLSVISKLWASA